jgi:hypothetical protein
MAGLAVFEKLPASSPAALKRCATQNWDKSEFFSNDLSG